MPTLSGFRLSRTYNINQFRAGMSFAFPDLDVALEEDKKSFATHRLLLARRSLGEGGSADYFLAPVPFKTTALHQ